MSVLPAMARAGSGRPEDRTCSAWCLGFEPHRHHAHACILNLLIIVLQLTHLDVRRVAVVAYSGRPNPNSLYIPPHEHSGGRLPPPIHCHKTPHLKGLLLTSSFDLETSRSLCFLY